MEQRTGPLAAARTDAAAWSSARCSLAAALDVVGTRSAMLLLRAAHGGTRRFDDFTCRVGITDAVAAARLRELTEAGLLRREPYREPGQRTRDEYVLTAMGRDLYPALLALLQWGDTYLAGPAGPPLLMHHAGCGQPVAVHVACTAGHQVPLQDIEVRTPACPSTPTVGSTSSTADSPHTAAASAAAAGLSDFPLI